MDVEELTRASAVKLAEAIRTRQVSATELVTAYLDAVDRTAEALGAIVHLAKDSALERARAADDALARGDDIGPLHGVPVTIKDLIAVAGMPCTSGTVGRAAHVPEAHASVVARLLAAGAIVLGKTNTPEIGFAIETDNLVFGRTQNPYDLERTPGGSSGGEAAILASGGSPLGIGSDSGGSIRLPAHFCGIAGLCPTPGRVPRTGTFPPHVGLGQERAALGPMARHVADLVYTLPILSGPDGEDPLAHPMPLAAPADVALETLRVAYHTDNGVYAPERAIIRAVEQAARFLDDAGARVESKRPAGIEQTAELTFGLSAEGLVDFDRAFESMGTSRVSPLVQDSIRAARAHAPRLSLSEVNGYVARLNRFRSEMTRFLQDFDVILCPVAGYAAPRHGELRSPESVLGITYTQTYNLTGWPAATVRVGTAPGGPAGLPVGVQIVAAPTREDFVLRVALELERGFGGYVPPRIAAEPEPM